MTKSIHDVFKKDLLIDTITKILTEKDAQNILYFDLNGSNNIYDGFIICHGHIEKHVKTLCDHVVLTCKQTHQIVPDHCEGMDSYRWCLLDYGALIVHIFEKSTRQYYNLERLWNDMPSYTTKHDGT